MVDHKKENTKEEKIPENVIKQKELLVFLYKTL